MSDTVSRKVFPRQPNQEGGWLIDAKYLSMMQKFLEDSDHPKDEIPSMEQIEMVLWALERIPSTESEGEAPLLKDDITEAISIWETMQMDDDPVLTMEKVIRKLREALPPTSETVVQLRPTLRWFAEQMELVLRANDHKGGWSDMTYRQLRNRLNQEVDEMEIAQIAGHSPERLIREAADVANFAMMIADNHRRFIPGIKDGREEA